MQLAFILTMPGNNSWNGRWSGDGKLYAVTHEFLGPEQERRAAELIAKRNFGYDFGDGWRANIEVREVDALEATQMRDRSQGFYGYDWMIDSILAHGKIMRRDQEAEFLKSKVGA
jgi:hypothetical protein